MSLNISTNNSTQRRRRVMYMRPAIPDLCYKQTILQQAWTFSNVGPIVWIGPYSRGFALSKFGTRMQARPSMHTLLYWTDTECTKRIKRSNKILNVTRIKLYPWSAALLGSIATRIESSLGQSHVHCFLGLLVHILDLLVQLINFVLLLASFEIRNLGFQLRHLLLILPVRQTREIG